MPEDCLQEYVSLCFSPDSKLLLAQGAGPDWSLLLWAWEKSKVACSLRSTNLQGSPMVQASISPGESGLVTAIGAGVLKMFKITEQALKPLPLTANRRDSASFTCMVWVGASGDGTGGASGSGGQGAADAGKASAGGERARQLLGTQDGEVLMFEVWRPRVHHYLCACACACVCELQRAWWKRSCAPAMPLPPRPNQLLCCGTC